MNTALQESKPGVRNAGEPELKPWMERIFQAAGLNLAPSGRGRQKLIWFGVEMQRFLTYCRDLPVGTAFEDAAIGYGRVLESHDPALERWRLDQAREALRVFGRGTEGWAVIEGDEGRRQVKFHTKRVEGEKVADSRQENALEEPVGAPRAGKIPEMKEWMVRICRGAGVVAPNSFDERRREAWWGVEMQRFLKFCREEVRPGTELFEALKAYGAHLKGRDPVLEGWQIDQAREALRVFRRGVDGWRVVREDDGSVRVKFRTKARPEVQGHGHEDYGHENGKTLAGSDVGERKGARIAGRLGNQAAARCVSDSDGQSARRYVAGPVDTDQGMGDRGMTNHHVDETSGSGAWNEIREKFEKTMAVRRYAKRTREAYGSWAKRYLGWTERRRMAPWRAATVERFVEALALERNVAASTQNQALNALVFWRRRARRSRAG